MLVKVIVKIYHIVKNCNNFVSFQCLQYKTEIVQDLKKVEKFINNLMRHMVQKSSDAV
jgi:hypothetical protein